MIATTAIGERLVTTGYQPGLSEWDITAHHEASHVAAYLFHGLRFRRAVLWLGDNGVEGAVRVGIGANGDYGSTKRGVICLAGACGEARYCQANVRDVLSNTAVRTDVEMAMDALQADPRAVPFDVVLAAAQRLVEQRWVLITKLADQLGRRGELSYEECRLIVTRR